MDSHIQLPVQLHSDKMFLCELNELWPLTVWLLMGQLVLLTVVNGLIIFNCASLMCDLDGPLVVDCLTTGHKGIVIEILVDIITVSSD